ncbi:MAG TPA: sigma-70 family RNA polymerase sigma factor [Phycisphaerales bacterium]|nr:sigma-70 family RNA polymerase sigma factor [Phycisphaerales bacterium]
MVAPDREDDLELMSLVAKDDEAAIARLYDRFGSLVYRMAYQAMPSRSDAEEVVQEVFIRLWRTAGRFDPKRASLVTWVMLISRRHIVDRLRRTRARVKPTTLEEDWSPAANIPAAEAGMELDERFGLVMKRIEKLPELQRTVVQRAYLNGQTLKQIGIELGIPLGTIKSALSRALVRLREHGTGEELTA